jgi:hypothetical protein
MKPSKSWNFGHMGLVIGAVVLISIVATYSLQAVGLPMPTPTPCFGCPPTSKGTPVPTVASFPISRSYDLAPRTPVEHKIQVIVRRSNGQYEEYWVPEGIQNLEAVVSISNGDQIVLAGPSAAMMGQHAPPPTSQHLRASTAPMSEKEAIDFASQVLRGYGLQDNPDSVTATRTTWGKVQRPGIEVSNPDEVVWVVTIHGTFVQGRAAKLQLTVVLDDTTSEILSIGGGLPGYIPPGFYIPSTPTAYP